MENKKCKLCEEEIKEEKYYTKNGDPLCEGCYNYCREGNNTTIKIFSPKGKHTCLYNETIDLGDDDIINEFIKKEKWVSTDAWRGYTDWKLQKGFEKITNGWITQYPDETTKRKMELSDYFEKLENEEIVPPAPIYWIFGRTSNVFSTASMIVVAKKDEQAIKDWLNEINKGVGHFQEMFS